MDEVLVAENVRRSYGDTVAVDGVSVSVGEGEIFGLIGPNGAGKTTLIRALTGTTDAEGEVRIFDTAPHRVDPARIGLLPQSFQPRERLTARELIDYYGGLYDERRSTAAVLSDVGLSAVADTWYENLSGGQQRRACVGISLVNDPDVLFLDEPTTGIDPAGRRALWELLEGLAASGTTIFLTSHSMTEVQRLADRVGLLRGGSLVAVGSPQTLLASHGGESRLVIEMAEPAVSAAATAAEDAGYSVEESATNVVVFDVSPIEISAIVEAIDAAGVEYDSLTWTEPTLEDVYLQLTGETFEGT
ncbi:MAG: ABC transporter ATP-binding protein, partial [Halobacteriota archaeon]